MTKREPCPDGPLLAERKENADPNVRAHGAFPGKVKRLTPYLLRLLRYGQHSFRLPGEMPAGLRATDRVDALLISP